MNDYRLDNVLREVGTSLGYPGVGEFAADLTIVGTVAALGNQALNLSPLGKYPRGGIKGPGLTSWQHRLGGAIGRWLKMPSIGAAAKLTGRVANRVSGALIAFEAGYETGTALACAAIAARY
jgi:hypothetical protein